MDSLVTRTEEIVVDRPLAQAVAAIQALPLPEMIDGTTGLPGVRGTHVLTPGGFGAAGSRHMVFLTDGSTIVEQILDRTQTEAEYRQRYVVWNYTTPAAKPIRYGLAEFRYTPEGDSRTRIRWTYGFELYRDRFPGSLGGVGRWLLKAMLLDGPYAKWMQGTLRRMRAAIERA
jgi:hypothetical protein